MKTRFLALTLLLLAISAPAISQEQGIDPALDKQLTATERQEYQNRMEQAENDAQRNQITQQYRKTVEQRTGSGGAASPAGQTNQHQHQTGAHGQGAPAASKPGPAGSKNKPQKSGH